jgi:hypothetical protein
MSTIRIAGLSDPCRTITAAVRDGTARGVANALLDRAYPLPAYRSSEDDEWVKRQIARRTAHYERVRRVLDKAGIDVHKAGLDLDPERDARG